VTHPRPDYELEFVVASTLSNDPAVARERVAARSESGVVYLSGVVDAEGARRIAEEDVLGVPGVRGVVNNLVVHAQERQDEGVAATATRLLQDDPWLDDSRVQAVAERATVRLTGYVGSPQEWVRAKADAALASPVAAVDAAGLRIDRWVDDGTLRGRAVPQRPDGDIGQSVLDAYVADPRVHPFVPTVEVHDGAIILTGVAPNAEAARAAEDDARNVVGVSSVHDDVKVAPTLHAESDGAVREEVERAIGQDPRLGREGIRVDVKGGRVFLSGTVATEEDRVHAVSIATAVPGARDASDGLVLAPPRIGVTSPQPQ
jgi:osmotically-inducible protein OsmY